MELVLLNEQHHQSFELPAAPEPWIRLHKVAMGASLAAGALAYSVTHISGKATTSALTNTITIGGSILAQVGRYLAGDLVGLGIQTGTRTTAYVVQQAGESATFVGSLLASTTAAVAVGSTFLVGNTLYDIYKSSFFSKPLPEMPIALVESIEELPDSNEYVVYRLEDAKPQDMEAVD
jgi:hypothetical protein